MKNAVILIIGVMITADRVVVEEVMTGEEAGLNVEVVAMRVVVEGMTVEVVVMMVELVAIAEVIQVVVPLIGGCIWIVSNGDRAVGCVCAA